jgi:hypothetical protein
MEITLLGKFGEVYSGNTNLEVKPEDLSRSGWTGVRIPTTPPPGVLPKGASRRLVNSESAS